MKEQKLQTVVEVPEFEKQAKKCMALPQKDELIEHIARFPMEGDVIKRTGGARKIRWASKENAGKSGGVRVIYYYHNRSIPIFLFTVYGKGKKANL